MNTVFDATISQQGIKMSLYKLYILGAMCGSECFCFYIGDIYICTAHIFR